MSFEKGTRVRLSGLVNKSELNGTVHVVLKKIENKDRWAVTGGKMGMGIMSIATRNLTRMRDGTNPIDWSLANDGTTIKELVLFKQLLGNFDECHEFVDTLRRALMKDMYKFAHKPQFTREEVCARLLYNSGVHCVYFFEFDAIAHHFVLETFQGRARLFQSFVKSYNTDDFGGHYTFGYTSKEWLQNNVNGKPWKTAHKKYGGGRVLDYHTLCELVNLLFRLQDESQKIIDSMMTQLPKSVATALLRATTGSKCPVSTWAKFFADNISTVSISSNAFGDKVFSNTSCPSSIAQLSFNFPRELVAQFREDFFTLTGHHVQATQYLMMLHYFRWRDLYEYETSDHPRKALGWAFSASTISKN